MTVPLRVALLEDEPLARRRLARLLSEAGCEVLGEFAEGAELLDWLQTHPVDALFLDIQLPGANGFEVLAELPNPPSVVFVTASVDQAVRAFQVRAVDYLVKPVYEDRLGDTLQRLRERKALGTSSRIPLPTPPAATQPTRITIKAGDGKLFLELRRVTHFEVDREVVWAWCGSKQFRTLWTCTREVEEALPGTDLVRIQRNILLRPQAVIGFRPILGGRMKVRLPDGLELEVSRSATPQMRERLGVRD